MNRYQVVIEVVNKLTEKSRPSSSPWHSTHRMPGQNPTLEMSTKVAPGMRDFLGPVMLPGSMALTSIVTALCVCQGTKTARWFLAYLCPWKMVRLCIQYLPALLSWLTSFLPTEKHQGSTCQEQKSPERSCCGELLVPLGWKKSLSYRNGCGVCPKQCTYQKL